MKQKTNQSTNGALVEVARGGVSGSPLPVIARHRQAIPSLETEASYSAPALATSLSPRTPAGRPRCCANSGTAAAVERASASAIARSNDAKEWKCSWAPLPFRSRMSSKLCFTLKPLRACMEDFYKPRESLRVDPEEEAEAVAEMNLPESRAPEEKQLEHDVWYTLAYGAHTRCRNARCRARGGEPQLRPAG